MHAGTNLRAREIVLDRELAAQPGELARILIHEVFHFAWVRLGNPRRASYAALVEAEFRRGARGELGWSAEYRKVEIRAAHGRAWREYVCESFCDTAAWRYGRLPSHGEHTLAASHRARRARWFAEQFRAERILV